LISFLEKQGEKRRGIVDIFDVSARSLPPQLMGRIDRVPTYVDVDGGLFVGREARARIRGIFTKRTDPRAFDPSENMMSLDEVDVPLAGEMTPEEEERASKSLDKNKSFTYSTKV